MYYGEGDIYGIAKTSTLGKIDSENIHPYIHTDVYVNVNVCIYIGTEEQIRIRIYCKADVHMQAYTHTNTQTKHISLNNCFIQTHMTRKANTNTSNKTQTHAPRKQTSRHTPIPRPSYILEKKTDPRKKYPSMLINFPTLNLFTAILTTKESFPKTSEKKNPPPPLMQKGITLSKTKSQLTSPLSPVSLTRRRPWRRRESMASAAAPDYGLSRTVLL